MELFSKEHYKEVLYTLEEELAHMVYCRDRAQREADEYHERVHLVELDMDRIIDRQRREGKT